MNKSSWWVRHQNRALKRAFASAGLDLAPVWTPSSDNLELENRQLRQLLDWVEAYRACPDRVRLESRGWLHPPIDPDIDPESDWLRWERWMRREPLQWNFAKEFGVLRNAESMSDPEVETELERTLCRLEQRGVALDVVQGATPRDVYAWLSGELLTNNFEIVAPGTTTHIYCDFGHESG